MKRLGYIAMTNHGPVTDGRDAIMYPTYEDALDCVKNNPLHPPVVSVVGVVKVDRRLRGNK